LGTSWSAIIADYGYPLIQNDFSLDWDLANRPAVFWNRVSGLFKISIPLFNRPPEQRTRLKDNTPHSFTDYEYISATVQTGPVTIDTGIEDYELCSCGLVGVDDCNTPYYTPLTATYDADTGEVVIAEDLTENDVVDCNFFTSGTFTPDLSEEEKSILGQCFYVVYERRFDNDVAERRGKIHDNTFNTTNEGTLTNANTERQKFVDPQLFDMLRAYEQNICSDATVTTGLWV